MSEDELAVRIELPSYQGNDLRDAVCDRCVSQLRCGRLENGEMPCTS